MKFGAGIERLPVWHVRGCYVLPLEKPEAHHASVLPALAMIIVSKCPLRAALEDFSQLSDPQGDAQISVLGLRGLAGAARRSGQQKRKTATGRTALIFQEALIVSLTGRQDFLDRQVTGNLRKLAQGFVHCVPD